MIRNTRWLDPRASAVQMIGGRYALPFYAVVRKSVVRGQPPLAQVRRGKGMGYGAMRRAPL